ncbi:MAG TPA: GDSL-type esterase/lipase family protein [Waterburya sp.]|jgi:lysophospholipase L1-like esterase
MGEVGKIALLISIILNFFILGLASVWVYSQGGISYIIRKIASLQRAELRANSMYDSPYYWDKKTHFETLPKSESDVVFLGDSITDCCEWQELFRGVSIKNRGISGDTTNGILNRLDEVVQAKPKKVFIMIGINDINQGKTVSDIFQNYWTILKYFKEKTPLTKVFVQSLLPVNNQLFPNYQTNHKVIQLNTKIKELAQEWSFQYVDLFSAFSDKDKDNGLNPHYTTDGIHLNGRGYLVWKGMIEEDVIN